MSENHNDIVTQEAARLAARLRRKLQKMGIQLSGDKFLDRLPVDMTDVYFICVSYQDAVQRFLSLADGSGSQEVLKIVWELEQHLFIHLPYHYKPMAKGLSKLEIAVEPNQHTREQLALERLHAVRGKLSKKIGSSKSLSRPRRTSRT